VGEHRIEVLDTPEEVLKRGAELLAEAAKQAVADRGRAELAVSGGSDPWPMFSQFEDLFEDWDKAAIFQVDERVAPAGSDERNLTHLIESLSIGAQGSIKPMPVTDEDLDAAAARYAESLPERLDIAHLGIGPDGHTASLVPDDPVLDVRDRRVAVTSGEYQGVRRMTLTYPELEQTRRLLWVVTGESKVDALEKLVAQDPSTPSGRMRPGGDSLILADRAAAPNAGS
jgi:6-phosphogluconolactonase